MSSILSAGGDAFYAHTASKKGTEEKFFAAADEASMVCDAVSSIFAKLFPQVFFTVAFSSQLHSHLKAIGASHRLLMTAQIIGKFLPVLPALLALAPLEILFSIQGKNEEEVRENAAKSFEKAKFWQRVSHYTTRALEMAYAVFLVSRILHKQERIGAYAGLATLAAGLAYRYGLGVSKSEEGTDQRSRIGNALDKVFTWKPNALNYLLGGVALMKGPTRLMTICLLAGCVEKF